jgi:hypothetical protein
MEIRVSLIAFWFACLENEVVEIQRAESSERVLVIKK